MDEKELVKRDFDRLSQLEYHTSWSHNGHYHPYLLKHMPKSGERCLDIGCGTGDFSRILSKRFRHVEAIDFSSGMLEKARKQSKAFPNISYIEGDFLEYPLEQNKYDAIASIATVHHLPMEVVLREAGKALKRGGTLAILDLYENSTLSDWIFSAIAVPINYLYKLIKNKGAKATKEELEAWGDHSKLDHFMRIKDIRELAKKHTPGAKIKRHLFWRYSLIYKKP